MNEVSKERYRGVLCMSCRQPIPIPAILSSLELHSEDGAEEAAFERYERVFCLRCRSCNREKPYRSSDIVDFEGSPLTRTPQFQSPHAVGRRTGLRARAANG